MDKQRRKRRWWQFGLQSLFIVTLIAAAYGAGRSHRADRLEQMRAEHAAELKRLESAHAAEVTRLENEQLDFVRKIRKVMPLWDEIPEPQPEVVRSFR